MPGLTGMYGARKEEGGVEVEVERVRRFGCNDDHGHSQLDRVHVLNLSPDTPQADTERPVCRTVLIDCFQVRGPV